MLLWSTFAVKKLYPLLSGISSKHDADFYCVNCLHLFRAKTKVESHKKVYENKDFCDVVMPSEDTKILEFVNLIKHHLLFIQIEKIDGWKNNLGKSSTTKFGEDIRSDFLMSTKLPFKSILNKHGA